MKYILLTFLFLVVASKARSQEKIDSSDVFVATNFDNCSYGLKNKKGEWVLEPKYDYIYQMFYSKSYFIIEKNNLKGVVDRNGHLILNVEFEEINILEYENINGLRSNQFSYFDHFILKFKGSKGLYNVHEKKYILSPKFQDIHCVKNNVYFYDQEHKCGLLDSNGLVLKPKYDELYVFDNNLIRYRTNIQNTIYYGVINSKGKTLIQPNYYEIIYHKFENNVLLFAKSNDSKISNVEVFNNRGKILHHFNHFDVVFGREIEFNNVGTCLFSNNDSTYIINSEGRLIYRSKINDVRHLHIPVESTISHIINKGDICSVYNNQGKQIFKNEYESLELILLKCQSFSFEYRNCQYGFIAKKGKYYGIISLNDSVVLPFVYDNIYLSSSHIYALKDGKVNPYDYNNLNIGTFDYSGLNNIYLYSNLKNSDYQLFYSQNGSLFGLVHEDGTVILPPYYNSITLNEQKDKLYFSSKDQKNGYVDKNGLVVYNDIQNYSNVIPLIDNRYIVESLDGLLGLTDSNFNLLLEPKFNRISDVIDGDKIWVALDEEEVCDTCSDEENTENYEPLYGESKFLIYNIDGQLLNQSSFNNTSDFINQRAIVSRNGLYSILDGKGKELIPYEFDKIILHDSNYIFLRKNESWSIVDWNLKPVFRDTFNSVTPIFNRSIIFKDSNNNFGYQNLNGNTINNCIEYFNRINSNIFDSLNLNDVKSHFYWSTDDNTDFDIENFYHLDTIQNLRFKNLIKNDLASIILENLLFESGNYQQSESNYIDFHYPLNSDRSWEDLEGEFIENNTNDADIKYIDNTLVSYQTLYSSCYSPPRGMGHCDLQYNFYNYQFMNDSLHELKLGELFINGYYSELKKAFIKAYEELENDITDCKNLEILLSPESTNFIITESSLMIYIESNLMDIDRIDDFEVQISYSEIKNIIPNNSVLYRFLK